MMKPVLKGSLIVFSALLLVGAPALAQTFSDSFAGFGSSNGEPIEIESNELQVEDKTKVATFIGNVVVVQGDTRLETARLKVFYDGGGNSGSQPATAQQEISRLEAAGGVHISSKDQTATGDAANFDMKREVMVMTGREVVLSQGANVVVGNRLTVNLKTGQANLKAAPAPATANQGGGSGRVKVRILPNSVPSAQQ
ncbi:LptA/OstA family protein [Roseibium sp.]|uniref:LptA/OstA family protein n=1 Tax=Roseibium sp. TaxID=1936156 RepID=UPI003B515C07